MRVTEFDIGFLGGGQLARMSIQAAQRMGLRCLSLDPGADTPASQIAEAIQGRLDDPERVAEIFRRCDRVTLENEFIPASVIYEALELSARNVEDLVPTLGALETIQDKLMQRQALEEAGVPSPRALPIENGPPSLEFPMVLKARFGGYDGKGTRYAHTPEEFESHRHLWSGGGWLAEDFVPFKRELAVMVFVCDYAVGCFPTVETIQKNHVCDMTIPTYVDGSEIAVAAVEAVGGKGLFGVELFELEDGAMLVNEIAPRPHNTGHYTLDWGGVSQFEQHVRLVMGFGVDPPRGFPTCMVNLLGQEGAGDFRSAIHAATWEAPGVFLHWYGKAESRPGRKMGHINVRGDASVPRAIEARERFYRAWCMPPEGI